MGPSSSAALGAGPRAAPGAGDTKSRLIWDLQDRFPTQVRSDCLTSALYHLKLINLLTQD